MPRLRERVGDERLLVTPAFREELRLLPRDHAVSGEPAGWNHFVIHSVDLQWRTEYRGRDDGIQEERGQAVETKTQQQTEAQEGRQEGQEHKMTTTTHSYPPGCTLETQKHEKNGREGKDTITTTAHKPTEPTLQDAH